MTEPHSPAQTAAGPPIPGQFQQTPGDWPAGPVATQPKRSRAGLIAALVLAGVLVLCSGIAGTAIYVSSHQYGTGASSPDEAVTDYLTAAYLHQETSEAQSTLCQQADPTALVTHPIRDAASITNKYNAAYSWSTLVVSGQTATDATVSTDLTASSDAYHATTSLAVSVINDNGWWVCGVQSSPH